MHREWIHYSPEVLQAMRETRPVVALESTIISHGLPWPSNIETALAVEDILRAKGVTPATIAIFDGKIHIGLEAFEMTRLAQSQTVLKASRRDLAYALTQKCVGTTTVAATMYCAHLAGIPLFVTGGIGGVHHDVASSFDISADLIELCETPVTVICAGAKSILDLPKTLEVLETHGVPVIGFQTDEFPAFYSQASGIPLLQRLNSPEDIAELMRCQKALGLKNGIVVANPIPAPSEIPLHTLEPVIAQAQREASDIHGKAVTPFLLSRINELTAGQSVRANIELIKNNALLGANIANALNLNSFEKKVV
ncbi:pseudouridine-5'-phosphate glycosidase [Legionella geestiana]|uniref:pseudouridine-5'-phosphate glycosidase n=1 Tax=Legionella geestiana TaxID=45065 RepID=UPI001091DD57|nr:pseudouridine-5'-phosphate glycosidase [Legionella geestiana]QDQ40698.1 pseudouridine-5'-phosphate glycosidase [Legionella geestiana]